MKFPRNAKIFRGQLDVAPFASVFFLLTIFMVFSSLLVSSPGVEIELPELAGTETTQITLPKLDIAVNADGKIFFESQIVPTEALPERLAFAVSRFEGKAPSLVLQADKNADLETLLQICRTAVEVGIKQTVWIGRDKPFPPPAETTPAQE